MIIIKGLDSFVMVAMEKCSYDPREDFKESMVEMIMANRIEEANDLGSLLNYYIIYMSMNSKEYHGIILEVFYEVLTRKVLIRVFITEIFKLLVSPALGERPPLGWPRATLSTPYLLAKAGALPVWVLGLGCRSNSCCNIASNLSIDCRCSLIAAHISASLRPASLGLTHSALVLAIEQGKSLSFDTT
ncbi:hypothetical protein LWI28_028307 [Acer negundo]|uniref:Transcription repressor n=1 Tax=Acer negundo TaxID=4023 RepID=A0AAD5JSP6_ACENE|nr:hypothetical protein LWI28_028307 [Acer negundo]